MCCCFGVTVSGRGFHSRLKDHLGPILAVINSALIKVLISLRRFAQRQPMADDEAGSGATLDDHVAQVLVIFLDRRLALAETASDTVPHFGHVGGFLRMS